MQRRESQVEKHGIFARQFLDVADQFYDDGDIVQASEKLWGAMARALKSVCIGRRWKHGKYGHLRDAITRLTQGTGDGSLLDGFNIAYSHYLNFYSDAMEDEDVALARARIRRLVDDIMASGKGDSTIYLT